MENYLALQFDQKLDDLITNARISPAVAYYILENKTLKIAKIYEEVIQKEKLNISESITQAVETKINENINQEVSSMGQE